ncbi:MAG: hypothetical protein J5U17_08650 [Candidatus Methanoperedens sp.]|nr:hypothetical protein [Candidatus Methanoperedens sp.]MCE8429179.1 hypothetical protein [Candidatus Methanoperedens sp.]
MNTESKPLKTFALSEREKIREHFTKRAREAPIVSPLDPSSMEAWWDYVDEMREIEQQLREAGEQL